MCRLDVAYPVSVLSQYMLNPSEEHFKALNRVICYLANHSEEGLIYKPSEVQPAPPLKIIELVDASYGGHAHDCKSHTGMIMATQPGIIHYRSVSQKTVSTSSSHAEAKGAFTMAKEIMALKGMVAELHPSNSIHSMSDKASIVCVDNKATVDLLLEPKNQEKSRHWLIAYKWVLELQKFGILRYKHIYGNLNVSDLLTKPVSTKVFDTVGKIIQDGKWSEIIRKHESEAFKKYKSGG